MPVQTCPISLVECTRGWPLAFVARQHPEDIVQECSDLGKKLPRVGIVRLAILSETYLLCLPQQLRNLTCLLL